MNTIGGTFFYVLLRILLFFDGLEDFFMNINWLVRLKNKSFWLSFIPAMLLLVQAVAAVFGFTLDFGPLGDQLLEVVNLVFIILSLFGVVTDPTTAGISDSKQALTYTEPKKED